MNLCLLILCLASGAPDPPRDRLFSEDKWKHLAASFVLTSLAASGARAAGMDAEPSRIAGAAVGMSFGVWKEVRDARAPGGRFSALDLVWDAAGVGAATAVQAQTD